MSEPSLHATLCGKFGVPVVAVIGDEAACRQAKEYMPGCYTCEVKKATQRNIAVTDPNAYQKMRKIIVSAIENYKSVPLYKVSEPITVEQTFYRTDFCESAIKAQTAPFERVDARTLKKTVSAITDYADLKF